MSGKPRLIRLKVIGDSIYAQLADGSIRVFPVIRGGTSSIYNQNGFAFYDDDNTWTIANDGLENDNLVAIDGTNYILRVEIEVTNAKAVNNILFDVYAAKNGGSYTQLTTGRTDGLRIVASSWFSDAASDNNNRLSSSSLTFTGGELDSDGAIGEVAGGIDFVGQDHWEVGICLEIDTANASASDYWDIRIEHDGGGALDGYSRIPRITYTPAPAIIDLEGKSDPVTIANGALRNRISLKGTADASTAADGNLGTGAGENVFTNSPSVCDHEENDLTDWDYTYTSGSVTLDVVSTPTLEGSYCARCQLASTTVTASAYMRKLITWPAGDIVYCYWKWRCDDRGALNDTNAMRLWTLSESSISSANRYWRCDVNPNTATITVYATDSTGNFVNTGITWTFSDDTNYEIEIMYDRSGTNAKLEMWVDGSSQGSWEGSGQCTELSTHALVLGGYHSTTTTDNWIYQYYDEVRAEDARIGTPEEYVDLEGKSDPISSTSGAILKKISLIGVATSTSSANGFLSKETALFGAANSQSTANGSLSISETISLEGASDASSGASGVLSLFLRIDLQGSADAISSTIGKIVKTIFLSGIAEVQSSAIGIVSSTLHFAGESDAASGTSGSLSIGETVGLQGIAIVESAADGFIRLSLGMRGLSAANASVYGALLKDIALMGESTAGAASQASLRLVLLLQGIAEAQSSTIGILSTIGESLLQGIADAQSSASAQILLTLAARGVADAVSTAIGDLSIAGTVNLEGASSAQSSASALLLLTLTMAGTSEAESTAAGILSIAGTVGLNGVSSPQSDTIANLLRDIGLSGQSASQSDVSGNLILSLLLKGSSASTSSAIGGLTIQSLSKVSLQGVCTSFSNAIAGARLVLAMQGTSSGNTGALAIFFYVILLRAAAATMSTAEGALWVGEIAGVIEILLNARTYEIQIDETRAFDMQLKSRVYEIEIEESR